MTADSQPVSSIPVALILAVSENGVIGTGDDLPWYVPTDFAFFKKQTMGKPLIMGRKTFDSIGKPLPNRHTIVVSRSPDLKIDGAETARSLDQAIALARDWAQTHGASEIMIGGGGDIYRQALPLAHRVYLTRIHCLANGSTTFPDLDADCWRKQSELYVDAGPRDSAAMTFMTYECRSGSGSERAD